MTETQQDVLAGAVLRLMCAARLLGAWWIVRVLGSSGQALAPTEAAARFRGCKRF